MKIAFLKGTDFVDTLIKLWTRSKYSHCEMVFSDGTVIGTSLGLPFKVIKRSFGNNPTHNLAFWDLIEVNVTPEEEALIRKHAESQIGKAYDWMGIFFSQLIPIKVDSKSKVFCSELCVESFKAVPRIANILNMKPSTVSPGKFSKLIPKI